jgi:hypothetical protein
MSHVTDLIHFLLLGARPFYWNDRMGVLFVLICVMA